MVRRGPVRGRVYTEGEDLMRLVQRAGVAVAAAVIGLGLLGSTSSASADTSWGMTKVKVDSGKKPSTVKPLDTSWGRN